MIFRLGELFCGPGGIATGALNAKIENDEVKVNILHSGVGGISESGCLIVTIPFFSGCL